MSISPKTSFDFEIKGQAPLSMGMLAYFRERQRNRIHELVLREFLKSGMTKAQLAHRMGRSPARITKWLAAPGNWELDTISDFLLAIRGAELEPSLAYPFEQAKRNYVQPDWLTGVAPQIKQESPKPDPESLGLSIKRPSNPVCDLASRNLADQLRAA